MVRADRASAGVAFTLDPDSGFRDVILVNGAWGLGENVVQGTVRTDEFYLYKKSLKEDRLAILVEQGIDSISFNPDAVAKGIENILKAEGK